MTDRYGAASDLPSPFFNPLSLSALNSHSLSIFTSLSLSLLLTTHTYTYKHTHTHTHTLSLSLSNTSLSGLRLLLLFLLKSMTIKGEVLTEIITIYESREPRLRLCMFRAYF